MNNLLLHRLKILCIIFAAILTGIAFKDDGQIADLHVTKKYHAGDNESKTIVIVENVRECSNQTTL